MRRRRRGELERDVLRLVRRTETPATARVIMDGLEGPLAYTTVQTTLTRLVQKGALVRSRGSRGFTYRPAAGTSWHVAQRMA
jgi:predicted transcriptional regulator